MWCILLTINEFIELKIIYLVFKLVLKWQRIVGYNSVRLDRFIFLKIINIYSIMAEMDEEERKVVNEFCHLLEKSKQLFNGLR